MTGSHNLALLSPKERKAVHADLLACQYRAKQKAMGKDWRPWVLEQLGKLPPDMAAAVKEQLNARGEAERANRAR